MLTIPYNNNYYYYSSTSASNNHNNNNIQYPLQSSSPYNNNLITNSPTNDSELEEDNDMYTPRIMMSVTEIYSKSNRLIGLSLLDLNRPSIILESYMDNASYNQTLLLIEKYNISILLINESAEYSTPLLLLLENDLLSNTTASIKIMKLKRKYFNENVGIELLNKYASKESLELYNLNSQNNNDNNNKTIQLKAVSALMLWLIEDKKTVFAEHSMQITERNIDYCMKLDLYSVYNMQILNQYTKIGPKGKYKIKPIKQQQAANKRRPNKAQIKAVEESEEYVNNNINANNNDIFESNVKSSKCISLYDYLNYCRTSAGAKMLRENCIQPSIHLGTINYRLDALEELLTNQTLFHDLNANLGQFEGVDTVCYRLAKLKPNKINLKNKNSSINRFQRIALELLQLFHIAQQFQVLKQLLGPCKSALLQNLSITLANPAIDLIGAELKNCFQSHASIDLEERFRLFNSRTVAEDMRNSLIQSIQLKDTQIDVERQIYIDSLNDIHDAFKTFKQTTQLQEKEKFLLKYSTEIGYFILGPNRIINNFSNELKPILIKIPKQGKKNNSNGAFQTLDLASVNLRNIEAFIAYCNKVYPALELVKNRLRECLPVLLSLSDCLALLDMILAFANVISLDCRQWSRPRFSKENNILNYSQARNPLLDLYDGQAENRPQNIDFELVNKSSAIITGVNGSGKSSYLKLCGVLSILAQIGCFVPCESCHISLVDQLQTVLITEYNFSTKRNNSAIHGSSLYNEIQQVEKIVESVNERKFNLVLMDEIGRSTSSTDGTALAFAIAEEFIVNHNQNTILLFTTHYSQIKQLPLLYSNCVNLTLKIEIHDSSTDNDSKKQVKYLYEVEEETENNTDTAETQHCYVAINLAEELGMNSEIIAGAMESAKKMEKMKEEELNKRLDAASSDMTASQQEEYQIFKCLTSNTSEDTITIDRILKDFEAAYQLLTKLQEKK